MRLPVTNNEINNFMIRIDIFQYTIYITVNGPKIINKNITQPTRPNVFHINHISFLDIEFPSRVLEENNEAC